LPKLLLRKCDRHPTIHCPTDEKITPPKSKYSIGENSRGLEFHTASTSMTRVSIQAERDELGLISRERDGVGYQNPSVSADDLVN